MALGALPPRELLDLGLASFNVPRETEGPRWPGCETRVPGIAPRCAPEGCADLCDGWALLGAVDVERQAIFFRDPNDGELKGFRFPCLDGVWGWSGGCDPADCIREKFLGRHREPCPWEQISGTSPPPGFQPGEDPRGPGAGVPFIPRTLEPELPFGLPFGLGDGEGVEALLPMLANLVFAILNVSGSVKGAGFQLSSQLAPALQQLAQEQGGTSNVLRDILTFITGTPGERAVVGARVGATAEGQALLRILEGIFERIRELAKGLIAPLYEGLIEGADALVGKISDLYVGSIDEAVEPEGKNLNRVAGQALTNALAAGLSAQLSAQLLEVVHPLKSLGLHQISAFIADFGGFGDIASSLRSPTLFHALRQPAERRAAAKFRTNLPSAGDLRGEFAKRKVPASRYAERLRLDGMPEWWVEFAVRNPWRDPGMRDIASVLDLGSFDAEWVAAKMRDQGFDDRDTEQLTEAVMFAGTSPGRVRLRREGRLAFTAGVISLEEFDELLQLAIPREVTRRWYIDATLLQRRRRHVELIARAVLRQYREDLLSEEAARQLLESIRLTPEEVTLRLVETGLDRSAKLLNDEKRDAEATIRQVKSEATRNLERQFRAGFLTREEAGFWLVEMGYSEIWARLILDNASLMGAPTSRDGGIPMGAGAFEEAAKVIQTDTRALVRDRILTPEAAVHLLEEFGLSRELAEEIVAVARGLGIPVPDFPGGPVVPEGEIADFWRPIVEAVGTQLRERGLDTATAVRILEKLGLPSGVIQQFDDVLEALLRRLFAQLVR